MHSNYDVADISLAPQGQQKIEWAFAHMPVLSRIYRQFEHEQPFKGLKIAVSVHVEAKTACLAKTLAAGGADVALTGCNPLSTQDDVAAALAQDGMKVFCRYGVDEKTYISHLKQALQFKPHIVIDDGGDFAQLLHTECSDLAANLIGGSEETTTGVVRLKILSDNKQLKYPVIAVNDARCKHLFDNRYGTGQSVWAAIMSTTNLLIAGKTVVVAGFGMCGKGVAIRADSLGARVIVTEIDPVKACEALMEGYDVMTMEQAAPVGDIFVTVTGCKDILSAKHYPLLKNGAILCNAGHFDVEINLPELKAYASDMRELRKNITGYNLKNGRQVQVLAQGRLVNLAAGDGHPAEIMDMSFALQAKSAAYMAGNGQQMAPGVYDLPAEIDDEVAATLLVHLDKQTETLTDEQTRYIQSWDL